jgi:hypothetical protein
MIPSRAAGQGRRLRSDGTAPGLAGGCITIRRDLKCELGENLTEHEVALPMAELGQQPGGLLGGIARGALGKDLCERFAGLGELV